MELPQPIIRVAGILEDNHEMEAARTPVRDANDHEGKPDECERGIKRR